MADLVSTLVDTESFFPFWLFFFFNGFCGIISWVSFKWGVHFFGLADLIQINGYFTDVYMISLCFYAFFFSWFLIWTNSWQLETAELLSYI